MSAQPSLFDQPVTRTGDMDTAVEAGVTSLFRASHDRLRVLRALYRHGEQGLTDHEAAAVCGMKAGNTSAGKRRLELERAGLVEQRLVIDPKSLKLIGDKRVTPSGGWAAVWCITEAGVQFVRDHEGEQ